MRAIYLVGAAALALSGCATVAPFAPAIIDAAGMAVAHVAAICADPDLAMTTWGAEQAAAICHPEAAE